MRRERNFKMDSSERTREIIQADALDWLREREVVPGYSVITSLPDFSEFPHLSRDEGRLWFEEAARLVLSRTPRDGVTIFYQRDSKVDGQWISKSFLIQKAAEREEMPQLWHKIVCRATPGSATFGKPAYSHLLCFSRELRIPLEQSTPDILLQAGETTWARGMGTRVCEMACRFVKEKTSSRGILDPFCGHGTVLAVANHLGLHALGVEKGRKRAERARLLQVDASENSSILKLSFKKNV